MGSALLDEEIEALEACKTKDQWNTVCNTVKARCGGNYPSDWKEKVVDSGLKEKMEESWTIRKNISVDEMAKLRNSKSEKEWDAVCDEVKAARNGQYPNDWYQKVLASGLSRRAAARWGGTDEIQISAIDV